MARLIIRYDVRYKLLVSSCRTKSMAKSRARGIAVEQGANTRYKVRVYGLAEGQRRGELMYRCWVGKNGKIVGEDR